MMAVWLAGLHVALCTAKSGAFAAAAIPGALYICCALFSLTTVNSPMVTIDVSYPYLQGRLAVPAAAWGFAKSNTHLIKLLDGLVCAHPTKLSVDFHAWSCQHHKNGCACLTTQHSTFIRIPSAHCRMMCYMCPTATSRKAHSLHHLYTQRLHTVAGLRTASHTTHIYTMHVIPYIPCIRCIPCIPYLIYTYCACLQYCILYPCLLGCS